MIAAQGGFGNVASAMGPFLRLSSATTGNLQVGAEVESQALCPRGVAARLRCLRLPAATWTHQQPCVGRESDARGFKGGRWLECDPEDVCECGMRATIVLRVGALRLQSDARRACKREARVNGLRREDEVTRTTRERLQLPRVLYVAGPPWARTDPPSDLFYFYK